MEKRILSSQVRAARALIGWSQEVLAEASGVSISTIRDFEVRETGRVTRELAGNEKGASTAWRG